MSELDNKTRNQAAAQIPLTASEKDVLINQLRNINSEQMEKLAAPKSAPQQIKRKTLADFRRKNSNAVNLLRVAAAAYDQELNKYNTTFSGATLG